jgi:hypothetical protein
MVYRIIKGGELLGFKIGTDGRFDRAQIQGWIKSRMLGPKG